MGISGSIEERYGVPYQHFTKDFPSQLHALYADFDVMFCCEFYNASFTRQGNILVEHLRIDKNVILAGYALLETLVPAGSQNLLLDSYEYLINVREAVRSCKATNLPVNAFLGLSGTPIKADIKGPSVKVVVNSKVNINHFEGDITLCIKCLEWPSSSDWPTRKNRLWPSLEDVRRITSHGCHLVAKPISCKGGRVPAWRFSFSVAEVELSKLVPDTARRCFMALKVILKDHLQPVVPALSSYHIKTVFLNTLEKKPENFWVDENIEECFQTLLKELHDALESETCQHHWLKRLNLFDFIIAKTNRKRLSILVQKLEKIQEDPAPFIYDDGRCCVCPCFTSVRKTQLQRLESQEVLIDQDAAVDPANVTVIDLDIERVTAFQTYQHRFDVPCNHTFLCSF
ncbi:hypothetical protein QZH41_018428 [Actinostola sp. cb2023]|nr:hypothetical protein QZH41_018428 [Actinostola sp. cb2023]